MKDVVSWGDDPVFPHTHVDSLTTLDCRFNDEVNCLGEKKPRLQGIRDTMGAANRYTEAYW